MLDPSVRLEGFDTNDWKRVGALLRSGDPTNSQQGLLVLRDDARIVRAISGDLLPVSTNADSVVVCDKDEATSRMTRLDAAQIAKWREFGSLGSLWVSGRIGGTRW